MTLDQFLLTVYVPLRLRGRSPETVRLLKHAIRQFSKHLGRPAVLEDFDDLVVSQFLAARAAKLSANSVARERSGILALWNLAQARGLVRLRPTVAPEVVPSRTPRAFSEEELVRLVDACRRAPGWIGPVQASVFWEALVAILLESGERINAVLSCPRSGWRRPWLVVPAEVRKGRRVERSYELSPEAGDLVDRASAHPGATLLWFPASQAALYKRWHVITRRAGLGDERDVQFHALRRTTASHLAAAEGPSAATSYLGHASDRTTRRSYLDPRITERNKRQPWEVLPRVFRPEDPPAASAG